MTLLWDSRLFTRPSNLSFGGFENFEGVTGVLAAVPAAAAVPLPSSFGEVNGIVKAPPVTAGSPAAVVDA
jgi:hypothetical protein